MLPDDIIISAWYQLKPHLQIETYDNIPLQLLSIDPDGSYQLGRGSNILTTTTYSMDDYQLLIPKDQYEP